MTKTEDLEASLAEVTQRRDDLIEDLAQARSEAEQAEAAQALAEHRTTQTEARAAKLQAALDYAIRVSSKSTRSRILGYVDRLNEGA